MTLQQTDAAWRPGDVTGSAGKAPVGLIHGTVIRTRQGDRLIETLSPGDDIVTRRHGFSTLRAVTQSQRVVSTICVRAGSLGHTLPGTDTLLPSAQTILIRDWRAQAMIGQPQGMIAAGHLVDDGFVCDVGERQLSLYVLSFDRSEIIYAGGLEVLCGAPAPRWIRPVDRTVPNQPLM